VNFYIKDIVSTRENIKYHSTKVTMSNFQIPIYNPNKSFHFNYFLQRPNHLKNKNKYTHVM